MDDSLFEGAVAARGEQTRAEAEDWARTLVALRAKLCAGGFTSREAYKLSRLWFGDQLYPFPPAVTGELGD
jgi:hypothetical protein